MKLLVTGLVACAVGLTSVAPSVQASPPPPPATPTCKWCGGPPPAPTPIPTLAPTVIAPDTHAVAVEISPTKVHRGGQTQVSVTASTDDKVTMTLRYSHGKATVYRTSIGKSGKLSKRWKIPKSAPVGKAGIKVDVVGDGKPFSATVSFIVTK